tara:strand:- start:728 stop:877 length:150 start_codon:yes stop_codon:yes gene_type:complete
MSVFEVRITKKDSIQILTIDNCIDQDDCVSRVTTDYPDWEIQMIRDVSQ